MVAATDPNTPMPYVPTGHGVTGHMPQARAQYLLHGSVPSYSDASWLHSLRSLEITGAQLAYMSPQPQPPHASGHDSLIMAGSPAMPTAGD